jgi:putative endonuclease
MGSHTTTKHTTVELGAIAEQRAVDLLVARGYAIVERNYAFWSKTTGKKTGELDIVARQGSYLVFVEVRSRADDEHGDAIETIDRAKQHRIARIAERYLVEARPAYDNIRFDVVTLNGDRIDLYVDAFRLGLLA